MQKIVGLIGLVGGGVQIETIPYCCDDMFTLSGAELWHFILVLLIRQDKYIERKRHGVAPVVISLDIS